MNLLNATISSLPSLKTTSLMSLLLQDKGKIRKIILFIMT